MSDTSNPDLAAAFRRGANGRDRDQLYIVGTEPPSSPEVDEAAERLREAEAACKEAREIKDTRAGALVEAMRQTGVNVYRYTDNDGVRWTMRVEAKTKVSVKRTGVDD